MHRHHHDGVRVRVILLNIRVEGNFLQKARQRGRIGVFHVGKDAGFQLADVFGAGARFDIVLFLEHFQIAGAEHDLLIEVRQRKRRQKLGAFLDHDREGHELRGGLFKARIAVRVGDDRVERHACRSRLPLRHFERFAADAARRVIDDALQSQLVCAVIDHAQIGQHILDLGAVKEACAADDAVRDAAALERVFHRVRLRVRAVEHGEILEILPLGHGDNAAGNVIGLIRLACRLVDRDAVARSVLRPELFALAPPVVRDDGVGRVQNGLRGAVVLLQADDTCALELLFKGKNVLDSRAAEFVDGLVVVADDADVFIPARKQRCQLILQLVRVLILVDHDVVELALVIRPHVLKLLKQLDGLEDDIVKVQRVGLVQALFVFGVELRDAVHAVIAGLSGVFGKLLRPLPLVLGLADDGKRQTRREGFFVQPEVLQNVLHDPLGIARVIDREAACVAVQAANFPAQNTAAGSVERHGPDVHGVVAQQRLQSGLQFICGLVGECDGQNRPRRGGPERAQALGLLLHGGIARFEVVLEICNVFLRDILRNFIRVGAFAEGDEIGDAVDENGRLAAARTGQQQQRPLRCKNALALHLVQVLKARSDHSTARG